MTAEVQSTALGGGSSLLEVGDFVDGRFAIESVDTITPLFATYQATDTDTAGPALVIAVAGNHPPEALQQAAAAKALEHKNIARLLAVGAHEGHPFLAYEYHEGHTLRQLLERKKATGAAAFNPKGALNIMTHIASGLGAAHPEIAHGCISLDTVVVNKAGRVVITGLGIAALLPNLARSGAMPDWASLSPEVKRGAKTTVASDVFSLGALAYYILTGTDPVKGCRRPSEAVPGLGPEMDTLVGRSMHQTPSQRYQTVEQFSAAFRAAVTSGRPSAEAPAVQPQADAPAARSQAPRPSLAQAIVAADFDSGDSGEIPVNAALQAALGDTDERYLINMGNLDYGPFTLQAVVDKIRTGEIRPGHLIIDKDTGNRQKVEEQPLLHELVEQAQMRRDEQRRTQAEEVHVSKEKRRGVALYLFIALGVIGIGGGAYLLVSKLAADKGSGDSGEVASLGEGDLGVKITPIKRSKRKGRRSGKRRGKKSGGAGGESGGWDDSLDLNMAEGGGTERLDDSQINPVIQRNGGSLGRCLGKTGSRHANIDFIIVGSGRVSQVRVNGKTKDPLAKCVRGAMKRMKFPSFNGPRTKANFNMSL